MKRIITQVALCLIAVLFSFQSGVAQCYQLGTTTGQLSSIVKTTISFCPTAAQAGPVCDCPAGYVAIGYDGTEGNVYGTMVLSKFQLRCRQLNSDGTLGAGVTVTCTNGTHPGATNDGPVDAAAGQALVGAEVRIGCAMDAIIGKSKPLSEILAALPNSTSNTMLGIGGPGGSPATPMYAPNGSVFVGMQTFVEPGNNPAGSTGIVSGVAWRYQPIMNVACASACAISAITVSNISACNSLGTPAQGDDTFTANVTVTFSTPPATGTLNLSGDATASIPVGSLGATSYTFTGVTMSADGTPINLTAAFSATPACTLSNASAGIAPASCSVITPPPSCSINSITTSNISACNNNGTPSNSTDDFFTANVTVTFANAPAIGTLNLTGSGTASVAVGSLGATSYTFTGVSMPTNGQPIQFTAAFSANGICSLSNNNTGMAPVSCSLGTPTVPALSEWGLILFGLIVFSLSVVFGTQQQQAMAMGNAGGNMATAPRKRFPFDLAVFLKVLPMVYTAFVVVFTTAMLFGYELTNADIPCSLLAGAVIAYLVQFVLKSTKK